MSSAVNWTVCFWVIVKFDVMLLSGCNRLDVYIHDYLVKRDLKATAQAFQAEGKVSSDPVGKKSQSS